MFAHSLWSLAKVKTSLNILSRIIENNNRLPDHLFFYRLWENQYGWSFDQFTTIEENKTSLRWSPWTQYNHEQQLSYHWQKYNWITATNWATYIGEAIILQPSSLQEVVWMWYGLWGESWAKYPRFWRARELEEFGTSPWRNLNPLRLKKDHCLVTSCAQRRPKKDSGVGCFPYSGIWGSHRDRCSVQSFSFKVCIGLLIENGEGETLRYRDPIPFWRF